MKTKFLWATALLAAPLGLIWVSQAAPPKKAPPKKAPAKTAGIVWFTALAPALKQAQKTGKPLFIDVYTDWCGPCKMLDQTVYRDKAFIAKSRNWTMVKINPEKSAAGDAVAKKYKVTGFPTMIFADTNGKQVGVVSGYAMSDWKEWLGSEMDAAKKKMGVLSARLPLYDAPAG